MSGKSTRPPRRYGEIWKMLRHDPSHTCTLELTHQAFVPRIKRMISKEKDLDVGFKLVQEIEKFRLKFDWNEGKKELTIRLVSRLGLVDIVS